MNTDREQIVNTKTNLRYGPTIGEMRLSRLSHPRATLVAMILLAIVFLLFGLFANAAEVHYTPAPNSVSGAISLIGHWVTASTGISV